MSGSTDEELEEELQRNSHYQMAQMDFRQGASRFAQGWAELNWAHDHFRSTDQWDKAARITEERADAMLAVRREKEERMLQLD